jgi:hypothetical protein
MTIVASIAVYAGLIAVVSSGVAVIFRRPLVPAPNVLLPDGTLDYLPSHTITVLILGTISTTLLAIYKSPPPFADIVGMALSDTGYIMLGLLLLIRKQRFRAVGFEGRCEVFWGGLGFLALGTLVVNRAIFIT